MATPQTIGLIGVGLMGHGIGKNILAKGYKLNVMANRNRGPVDSLVGMVHAVEHGIGATV